MTILIISHTGHYLNDAREIVGWGPTIKELDFLAENYGKVIHVACLYPSQTAPNGALAYQSSNVEFVPIPPYGGAGIKNKLKILTSTPRIIATVYKKLKKADIFQFRTPTSIGVFLIPLLTFFTKKKGWYKYAGNWIQTKKPLSYRIQKFMLERQERPVTINGSWPNQRPHIYTFENPSLNMADIDIGFQTIEEKSYDMQLTACFVGRLEESKGVNRILENLDTLYQKGITKIHFVGDGPNLEFYKNQAKNHTIDCIFHGSLKRNRVFNIFSESHINILPSASEGFPKTISEGICFGAVPIVSSISSIPQYINQTNGFLWSPSKIDFSNYLKTITIEANELKTKAHRAHEISHLFTFEAYCKKLEYLNIIPA